ncbi:UDP-N-acetylglucosamine--N-acetylmuramyl-(pentapeptide) pyrophosphoryl-undecaprenol N-acetylglucosamine transferase [Candidatus Woesebacteria bacterium]|nr:MAG: UDP-N-acetylglucosamine--N-acetylmuramyl-(pentapeptide) pyrophosphoryl-undecaprenol N-acetylglucosamine transferase [Candidatus Woesebacteria bacterium]
MNKKNKIGMSFRKIHNSRTDKVSREKVIVATGGHAGTTALAVIKEIKKSKLNWQLHWIGTKYAVEGKKTLTIEAKTMPQIDVKFHGLIAGKLQRKWSRYTLVSLAKIPFGFVHAFLLLKNIKPSLVLSFGGYAGFPVVVAAFLLRVPVVIQEQITGLGFANRMSLPFADRVALARKEGLKYAKGKGVLIGNPVNSEIIQLDAKKKMHTPPAIFIFAGSRGSQMINAVIEKLLPNLLANYTVYHHTGDLDYGKFRQVKEKLSIKVRKRYHVYQFIDPIDVPGFYEKSDILIGRAGANTVSEIMIVGIPAILIPLTWTNYQEQVLNANDAQKRNLVEVILPKDLTTEKLNHAIDHTKSTWYRKIQSQVRDLATLDMHASHKLIDVITEVMK